MRGAAVVSGVVLLDAERTNTADREAVQRGAAHHPQPDHDHVEACHFMPRFRSAPLTATLPRYCERTCCGSARPYGKRLPPVIAGFTFGLSQPMRLIMLGVLVWLAWGLDLVAAATV